MPRRSSELGLWAHSTDLYRDQEEALGKKESGIPDRKLGSQAGGGKGETQAMLCSPLLELTSVFRGWPGRQARLGTWLAGSLQEGLGPRPWLR